MFELQFTPNISPPKQHMPENKYIFNSLNNLIRYVAIITFILQTENEDLTDL